MEEYNKVMVKSKVVNKIMLLILDVDGVLTDGTKQYDQDHVVISKRFQDKDFTAIKRFKASGVNVVLVSGDAWNEGMAIKRNLDFYHSRSKDLSLDKSRFVDVFESQYGVSSENMAFVCDDYFDLSMVHRLSYTFCTSDAPNIVKNSCMQVLESRGGAGAIVELYDYMLENKYFDEGNEEDVVNFDKNEYASTDMMIAR